MITDKEKAEKIVNNIFSLGLNTNRTFYDMAYNSAIEMSTWKEQQMIEKMVNWIALHAEMYGSFNGGKLNEMAMAMKKAMEGKQ